VGVSNVRKILGFSRVRVRVSVSLVYMGPTKSRPEPSEAVGMPPGAVRAQCGSVESEISARPARNLQCGATFCNL